MSVGVQRFFANDRNAIAAPGVAITADNVRSASGTVRPGTHNRQGFGRVTVSGAYTGHADTEIDIEITGDAGAGLRVSQPTFVGAGNGTLSDLSAVGVDPQSITVRLVSTGTATAAARLDLGELALVAKAAGAAGNGIALTIAPHLVLGAAVGALPAAVSVGQSAWSGSEWDWGVPALLADGTLPASAPRLVFGGDTGTVYRGYKQWIANTWQYKITPAAVKAYPSGAAVQLVAGDYDVVLTQDETTETFEGVVTIYDLVRAVEASDLVSVLGVVVDDRAPGGLGVMDVPYRTLATARLTGRAGGKALMDAVIEVAAAAGAATQAVTVECTNNAAVGGERWAVVSSLGGALGEAVTGQAFDGAVQFTVPAQPAPPIQDGVLLIDVRYAARAEGEPSPPICLRLGTLGAKASSKSLTLTYARRPATGCECASFPVAGAIQPGLLGFDSTGGGDMTIDPELKSRLEGLYEYAADFIDGNVAIIEPDPPTFSVSWRPGLSAGPAPVYIMPTSNGHYYNWNGLAAATEPEWPVDGGTVYVDAALFKDMGLVKPHLAAAEEDIAIMYQVLGIMGECLKQIYSNSVARASWDSLWTQVQSDLTIPATAGTLSDMVIKNPGFMDKYRSVCDLILLESGILPGKFEASGAGSAVWQDPGDSFWWQINGFEYLPAFDNRVYHSARRDNEGNPYPTQEFAFAVACACPQHLKVGDTLTISIGAIAKTYLVGDLISIGIQAGQALATAGGVTGDDTLTFSVRGSANAFGDYALTATEPAYSDGGLALQVRRGAVPFVTGDEWRFAVESQGLFRWRRDGGAWSAEVGVGDTALVDGLSVSFAAGVAPAFVSGDAFGFQVMQPYAANHAVRPLPLDAGWQWTGDGAGLTVDFGAAKTCSAVAILLHSLPASAGIVFSMGDTAAANDFTTALDWRAGCVLALFEPQTYRYAKLVLADAGGGAVGWLWAGEPLALSAHAEPCRLRREYLMSRSSDAYSPTATALGAGWAAELGWNTLVQADVDGLLSIQATTKAGGDEPLAFMPNYLHPAECYLMRLGEDGLTVSDWFEYQPDDAADRLLSATLNLSPVWQT
jgi:hypothetical protein